VHGNVEWFSTIFDGDNVDPFPASGASVLAPTPCNRVVHFRLRLVVLALCLSICIDAVIKSIFTERLRIKRGDNHEIIIERQNEMIHVRVMCFTSPIKSHLLW
jgi:hypothetical protein